MPSPEHPPGGQPDSTPPREYEPSPYYQAARFQNERPAKKAYFQAQRVIYRYKGDVDLSAYRFLLNRLSHVAVIGSEPPEELTKRIKRILSSGQEATLPAEIVQALLQRRAEATEAGAWVEGHYRPGMPVYPPEDEHA